MTNAFKLLNIDKTASKKEIMRKVTEAMRNRRYNVKEIAEAQKCLFNPVTRVAEEFKYFLDIERCAGSLQADQPSAQGVPEIPLLDVFDG